MKRRGLGRGLDALLPPAAPTEGFRSLRVEELVAQPRAAPLSDRRRESRGTRRLDRRQGCHRTHCRPGTCR